MRVLMLSRADVHSVPGGDTIQMLETKSELEKLGVHVQLGTIGQQLDPKEYDLVHIFNWEQVEPVLNTYGNLLANKLPMVLSPIFWFHIGHWYDTAVSQKRLWNTINLTLGTSRSRMLYESWQQLKFRWGKRGQNLRRLLSVLVQLLPNSAVELQHLEKVLGLEGQLQERSTIVPNGVTRELFDPLPTPNEQFVKDYGLKNFVIQVARIQSAKNQLGLIQALSNTSFPIVFIGQPSPYEPEYVERCYAQAHCRGDVYFVNPKTPQELAGIYVQAAVHVLPSWRETPGLASLEAAAAGCRIVSTVNGSAQEYFGNDALYCDPRDSGSIRKAVMTALDHPSSGKLRNHVLEHFTWQVAAQSTLNTYYKALH